MCKRTYEKLFCVVTVLGLVGGAQAANVYWTGAGPDRLWSTPKNWDTGNVPTAADTARIERTPGPVITTDAAVLQLWGSGSQPDEVTIDGGSLTVGETIFLGRHVKHTTITLNSGVVTVGQSISVGYNGSGTLIVNDGIITIGNTLEIARASTTTGHVDLRGGVITTKKLSLRRDAGAVGTLDVGGGMLIVDGNSVPLVQGYINQGWITAYQEWDGGTLQLDYDGMNKGKTTLTAIHSLQPHPANHASVGVSTSQLQWTLPEPNQPGGVVTCVVYFGTSPDVEADAQIVVRKAVESVPVTLNPNTVYYWALDIYDSSVSDTEPVLLSPVFTFDTKNTPPVVDAGQSVVTWLANGTRTSSLHATITDNGPCGVQWTVVSEPSAPGGAGATIADPKAANTAITLRAVGKYVVQVEASDGEYTVADTLTMNVYADSCQAAQSLPGYVPLAGDLNGDCRVDDADLMILQQNWLKDNSLTDEQFIDD